MLCLRRRLPPPPQAVGLLTRFARREPGDYDDDAKADAAPVKRTADLIGLLAELQPAAATQCAAQLMPFFACK